jgi:hypothetical protein
MVRPLGNMDPLTPRGHSKKYALTDGSAPRADPSWSDIVFLVVLNPTVVRDDAFVEQSAHLREAVRYNVVWVDRARRAGGVRN